MSSNDPVRKLKLLLHNNIRAARLVKRARDALGAPQESSQLTKEMLAGMLTLPQGRHNERDILGKLVAFNSALYTLVPGTGVSDEHRANVENFIKQHPEALHRAALRTLSSHAHHPPAVNAMRAIREAAKRSHVCIDLELMNLQGLFTDVTDLGVTMFVYRQYESGWRPPFMAFAKQLSQNVQAKCVSPPGRVLYRWVSCPPPTGVCGAMSAHTDVDWRWTGGETKADFQMTIHLHNSITLPVGKYSIYESTKKQDETGIRYHGEEVIFPGTLTRRGETHDYDHTSDQFVGFIDHKYAAFENLSRDAGLAMIFVGAVKKHVETAMRRFVPEPERLVAVIPPASTLLKQLNVNLGQRVPTRSFTAKTTWHRVLAQSTWVANVQWYAGDSLDLDMMVTVYDHVRNRKRTVTVPNFVGEPFNYDYLSEVVNSGLGDDPRFGKVDGDLGRWETSESDYLPREQVRTRLNESIEGAKIEYDTRPLYVLYRDITSKTPLPEFGTVYFRDDREFGVLDVQVDA
jgi:hypothetical protein